MENTDTNSSPTSNLDTQIDKFFIENQEYVKFLENGDIDLESYISTLKNYSKNGFRCVRLKKIPKSKDCLQPIFNEILTANVQHGMKKEEVFQHPLFSDLILMPKKCKISHLTSYKSGQIYGIEVSSAVVVKSLNPIFGEHILDICCSPGAKLSYIADYVAQNIGSEVNQNGSGAGLILGNDINGDRLNICQSVLKKYELDRSVNLICQDGVKLSIQHVLDLLQDKRQKFEDVQAKIQKKLKIQALHNPDKIIENVILPELKIQQFKYFDKVLCDVECSHDGSLKHILKFIENSLKIDPKKSKFSEVKTSTFEEKQAKIQENKAISNKERKRRLKQLELNQSKKEKMDPYFSEYKESKQKLLNNPNFLQKWTEISKVSKKESLTVRRSPCLKIFKKGYLRIVLSQ